MKGVVRGSAQFVTTPTNLANHVHLASVTGVFYEGWFRTSAPLLRKRHNSDLVLMSPHIAMFPGTLKTLTFPQAATCDFGDSLEEKYTTI